MVKIKRTWETVEFTASKVLPKTDKRKRVKISQTVELGINRDTKQFNICEDNEEGIRFDNVDIEAAVLKTDAVVAALKYIIANL